MHVVLFGMIGLAQVVLGVISIAFAERISMFERRLMDRFPWTRVTGWSGTRKGTMSWRVVGGLLIVLGLAYEIPLLLIYWMRVR